MTNPVIESAKAQAARVTPPSGLAAQRYREAQRFDQIKPQPEIDAESRGVPAWCVFGVIAVLTLACVLLLFLLGSLFVTAIDAIGALLGGDHG